MSPYKGFALNVQPSAAANVLVVNPDLGFDASQPPSDLVAGQSPSFENLILRDGGMEPRPMLTLRNTNPQPFGAVGISGGMEVTDVLDNKFPLVSGTTTLAWYSNGSWSRLSYVSSNGISTPPNAQVGDYYDWGAQSYWPLRDEMLAVAGTGSYETLVCWQPNTTVFSNLTSAPRAKFVAALDNFLIAGNTREGTADLVQRIRWSDRGDPSNWTTANSGFVDLLDMRGAITRLMPHDNALMAFSGDEIWRGVRADFPNLFSFTPYDRTVGCPYSWTVAQTPLGLMFLGKDLQVYLLPRGGGAPQPIGKPLHPAIRNAIDRPDRAWAAYDRATHHYQLNYAVRGGSTFPQRAVWLNIDGGTWAPQSYDASGGALSVQRGFEIGVTSLTSSWDATTPTWDQTLPSWDEMGGASEERVILMGSSAGTLYTLSSGVTSDNGTVVQSRWRSGALAPDGANPERMQNVTRVDVRYASQSPSNLTLRFSADNGQNFAGATRVAFGTASIESSARVDCYQNAYHPTIELTSQGLRGWRVFGFQLTMRQGGR